MSLTMKIFSSEFHHVALQLLDLMHTLHTRAAQIHFSWAEEAEQSAGNNGTSWGANPNNNFVNTSRLWSDAWCPLLQGMARLCCDRRSHIRTSALTSLQRALLFHDLQTLSSSEWEAAFTHVLFPMLDQLLIPSQPGERTAMEETRTRAATLLGKVYLQHLTPLTTLQTFTSLWLTILDFMERFIKAASSDLLADAIPESLKNMLLVMNTVEGLFHEDQRKTKTTQIWELTWEKLATFLPNLMTDLFWEKQTQLSVVEQGKVLQQNGAAENDLVPTTVLETPIGEKIPVAEKVLVTDEGLVTTEKLSKAEVPVNVEGLNTDKAPMTEEKSAEDKVSNAEIDQVPVIKEALLEDKPPIASQDSLAGQAPNPEINQDFSVAEVKSEPEILEVEKPIVQNVEHIEVPEKTVIE